MIYFIQAVDGTGPIKIGFAVNPLRRLGEVQRMSPVKLTILATTDGDRDREARVHRYLSKFRLYGEWFFASETVMEFVSDPTQPLPELVKSQTLSPKVKPSKSGLVLKNEFGTLWKERELERGRIISVSEVCMATGLNWQMVDNMRTGKTNRFDSVQVGKLCKFFDVPDGPVPFLVFRLIEVEQTA